jgi:hypothetical protein
VRIINIDRTAEIFFIVFSFFLNMCTEFLLDGMDGLAISGSGEELPPFQE